MFFNTHIDQITNLIKQIESADKLLVVNELNIRSLFTPAAARQQAAQQASVQNLRVSLIVSGFARSQPASRAKGESAGAQTKQGADEGAGRKLPRG